MKNESNVSVKWNGQTVATIEKPEFYENRKEEICTKTFGTRSLNHPRIKLIEEQGEYLISGEKMQFLENISYDDGLDKYRLKPGEI